MRKVIILALLVMNCLFVPGFSIDRREYPTEALRRDMVTMMNKMEAMELNHRKTVEDLKRIVESYRKELTALKQTFEMGSLDIDHQKSIEDLKRELSELKAALDVDKSQNEDVSQLRELNQIMIKYGSNPEGLSALHYAVKMDDIHVVNILLSNGADVNSISNNETPLHIAAKTGNLEAVMILVNKGAEIDGRNGTDPTPLDYAAKYLRYADNPQNLELVKFLVTHGATRKSVKYYHKDNMCPVISGYLMSVNK